MRRRTLLATVGVASAGSLAGCSEMLEGLEQSSSPVPEIKELRHGDARMISADSPADDEYNVTIQNTGDAGDIGISLFWMTGPTDVEPSKLESNPPSRVWERELLEEHYFESGDRRTIEFRRNRDWGGWKDLGTFLDHYRGTHTPEAQRREREKVDWL